MSSEESKQISELAEKLFKIKSELQQRCALIPLRPSGSGTPENLIKKLTELLEKQRDFDSSIQAVKKIPLYKIRAKLRNLNCDTTGLENDVLVARLRKAMERAFISESEITKKELREMLEERGAKPADGKIEMGLQLRAIMAREQKVRARRELLKKRIAEQKKQQNERAQENSETSTTSTSSSVSQTSASVASMKSSISSMNSSAPSTSTPRIRTAAPGLSTLAPPNNTSAPPQNSSALKALADMPPPPPLRFVAPPKNTLVPFMSSSARASSLVSASLSFSRPASRTRSKRKEAALVSSKPAGSNFGPRQKKPKIADRQCPHCPEMFKGDVGLKMHLKYDHHSSQVVPGNASLSESLSSAAPRSSVTIAQSGDSPTSKNSTSKADSFQEMPGTFSSNSVSCAVIGSQNEDEVFQNSRAQFNRLKARIEELELAQDADLIDEIRADQKAISDLQKIVMQQRVQIQNLSNSKSEN